MMLVKGQEREAKKQKQDIKLTDILEKLGVEELDQLVDKLKIDRTSTFLAVKKLIDTLLKTANPVLVNGFIKLENLKAITENRSYNFEENFCNTITKFISNIEQLDDSKKYFEIITQTGILNKIASYEGMIHQQLEALNSLFESSSKIENPTLKQKSLIAISSFLQNLKKLNSEFADLTDLFNLIINLKGFDEDDLNDFLDITKDDNRFKPRILKYVRSILEYNLTNKLNILQVYNELASVAHSAGNIYSYEVGYALDYITELTQIKNNTKTTEGILETETGKEEQTEVFFKEYKTLFTKLETRRGGHEIIKLISQIVGRSPQNAETKNEADAQYLNIVKPNFLLDILDSYVTDETIVSILNLYKKYQNYDHLSKNKDFALGTIFNSDFVLNIIKTFEDSSKIVLEFALRCLSSHNYDSDEILAFKKLLTNFNEYNKDPDQFQKLHKAIAEIPKEFQYFSLLNSIFDQEKDQKKVYEVILLLKKFKFNLNIIKSVEFLKNLINKEALEATISDASEDLHHNIEERIKMIESLDKLNHRAGLNNDGKIPKSWLDHSTLEFIFNKFGNNTSSAYDFLRQNLHTVSNIKDNTLKDLISDPELFKKIIEVSHNEYQVDFILFDKFINAATAISKIPNPKITQKYLDKEIWTSFFSQKTLSNQSMIEALSNIIGFAKFIKEIPSNQDDQVDLSIQILDELLLNHQDKAWKLFLSNFEVLTQDKANSLQLLITNINLTQQQLDETLTLVIQNFKSIFKFKHEGIDWFVKLVTKKLLITQKEKLVSCAIDYVTEHFDDILESSYNCTQKGLVCDYIDWALIVNSIEISDKLFNFISHNFTLVFNDKYKYIQDFIDSYHEKLSNEHLNFFIKSVLDNFEEIFDGGTSKKLNIFLSKIEKQISPSNFNLFLNLINQRFEQIFAIDKNVNDNNMHIYDLPNFANTFNLQRLAENKDYIQEYGRNIIKFIYQNPKYLGRLFHIVSEIQAILDNSTSPNTPNITQQNIIQIGVFANSSEESYRTSFSVGQMIARSIGFLNNDLSISDIGTFNEYSPHPGFSSAILKNNKENENIFKIKDWENLPFQIFNSRDANGEIINSIKVKPLGIEKSFYYAYYITENDLVIKICLNLNKTKELIDEGLQLWQGLEHDIIELSKLSKEGQEYSLSGDASEFAKIYEPKAMIEWIKNRYPELKTKEGIQENVSWSDILEILSNNESIIFSQLYNTIKWRIKTLMAYESDNRLANKDLIRIMASEDHDVYYKICATLLASGVLSGDSIQNSHRFVFYDKMSLILNEEITKSVAAENAKPWLILTNSSTDDSIYRYNDYKTNDGKDNLIVEGQNLEQNFPELYTRIRLEFLLGNKIMVNNKIVAKEEFDTFEFIPGDRIEFLKR